ncbi:MAG: hypothetical protein K0Q81_670 [Paenibacillus sp.]|jgi:hypothetical protein|nr:hypothetical protein [Paenibacillus sp.]
MIVRSLANQPVQGYSKDKQTEHNRVKLTRTQRSELPAKEVKRLYARSNRVCEKCDRQRATEKAHIERRWKSESRPTAEDFAHLCKTCHQFCDGSKEGRAWLISFQTKLLGEAK